MVHSLVLMRQEPFGSVGAEDDARRLNGIARTMFVPKLRRRESL